MLKLKVFNSQTGEFQETALSPDSTPQGECLVGRASNCDLALESPDVSRVHGRIKARQGEYYYTDLGSANGSHINNEQVQAHQSHALKVNDLLRIADFVLLVEAIEPTESSAESSTWKKLGGDRYWTKGDLTVRCVRITNETADVKTFTFVAEPLVLFDYKPGQFVTLELEINGDQVLRSYSISSTPSRPHTLEITVKRVAAAAGILQPGLVSNWLHDNLKVGSQIKLSGPLGKFTCQPDSAQNPSQNLSQNLPQKLLFISAGSGITPVMSMSRWIADTAQQSDVVFFHCARTPRDVVFRQELEMMAARLPNFHLALSTTRPEPGQLWFGFTGRIAAPLLQMVASDYQERTVYVCGPNAFMQEVKVLLEGLGFPMQNYHEESFGAPKKVKVQKPESAGNSSVASSEANSVASVATPDRPTAPPISAPSPSAGTSQPVVVFSQSGKQVAGTESILELAEQEGIKIRSNCRQGVCGACKKRKLEGEVRYESAPDALDQSEQDAGFILCCVAAPVGRVVIEA
ncbi:MAG: FHA domain-containing protein [Drouetiella hepatica Uher 2000/2452]|jgi:ferredoxin-NADP reductase/ferredoxin|uniref:Ferredoxin--NADP reductase n=1 Tax=Drouetiella hepatica Uher 2000/2452 TaxID=904376 RepID=A0A951Q9N7_9CYAN|nr:FHA domain-containing protein [Drouetiella hepatica Uher 2000/2452]